MKLVCILIKKKRIRSGIDATQGVYDGFDGAQGVYDGVDDTLLQFGIAGAGQNAFQEFILSHVDEE